MADSVNNNLLNTLGILQKTSGDAKPRNELGQTEFFELMVAQLQNQDPLSPMESNEFLSQIAQFSSVNGISAMQQAIEQMSASFQSNQALQASTLVGRSVLVQGSEGYLAAGGTLSGAAEIPQSASEVYLNVYDAGGERVRQVKLGQLDTGLHAFEWDGLLDDGQAAEPGRYAVGVSVFSGNDTYAAQTLMSSRVDSVSLGRYGSATQLNLSDGSSIGIGQVRQIL